MDMQAMIKQLKTGDQETWNMIIDRYSKAVYNMAYNFAGNSDDAADITQDVFLKAYRNIEKFSDDHDHKSFSSWLLRLSKNHCIDYYRKQKHRRNQLELDENLHDDPGHESHTPEEALVRHSDTEYLREKLQLLPPDLRTMLIMRDIQDYSYQEIAESLELPLGTIKSRINRARTRLAGIVLKEVK